MAFNLTVKHNNRVFSRNDLSLVYKEINNKFKELPINEVESVIEEIETHNGLILKSGVDSFEFSHLTFQEYLVAYYIVRAGDISRFNYSDLLKIPDELAIGVALSSEPCRFLYHLLVNVIFKEYIDQDFFNKFFSRIELEKPDFEISAIICITLLSVYSNVCDRIQTYNNAYERLALKELEGLKDRFEEMIEKMIGNNPEDILEGYYEKNYDNSYAVLKAKGTFSNYRKLVSVNWGTPLICFKRLTSIDEYNFPDYLYWSKDRMNIENEK